NVIDSRIPRREPDGPVSLQAIGGYATAAREVLASGEVDAALAPHLVAHADASYTRNDDLDTGAFILSLPLREQAAASADPEVRALAGLEGELPNSDGRTFEAAGALAYVDGDTNV